MPAPLTGSIYLDFQGYQRLHTAAERGEAGAAREAAQQFEALFVQKMLESMRAATPEGGLLDSRQVRFYQAMFDRQVAVDMAQRDTVGLQPLILRQLGLASDPAAKAQAPADAPEPVFRPLPARRVPAALIAPRTGLAPMIDAPGAVPAVWKPESPAEFVREIWPHAVRAGERLGVAPRVLVAQAALETGWGQHMIERRDGTTSFNLFGIKAGGGWKGGEVQVPTLEYRDGVAMRERAGFRAYDSLAASFRDYVDLIGRSPRYADAVANAGDPAAYAQALQNAGYATDPRYADKIRAILSSHDIPAMAGLDAATGGILKDSI